jgi:hypothetical protein
VRCIVVVHPLVVQRSTAGRIIAPAIRKGCYNYRNIMNESNPPDSNFQLLTVGTLEMQNSKSLIHWPKLAISNFVGCPFPSRFYHPTSHTSQLPYGSTESERSPIQRKLLPSLRSPSVPSLHGLVSRRRPSTTIGDISGVAAMCATNLLHGIRHPSVPLAGQRCRSSLRPPTSCRPRRCVAPRRGLRSLPDKKSNKA